MKKKRFLSILTSLIMTASLTVPVFADTLEVVDSLQVLKGVNLTYSSAQSDTVIPAQNVSLAIQRNGDYAKSTKWGQIYKENQKLVITATSDDSNVSATGGSITLPSLWQQQKNGDLSELLSSNVTVYVPKTSNTTDGAHLAKITYTAKGTNYDNSEYIVTNTINVHYTVDNTAPVLTAPDITVDATGTDGAIVEFTATANDAIDGSVSVTYDKTSGSKFPVGTTIVNCSATDEAGNTATASFNVTVNPYVAPPVTTPADTTAPIVTATADRAANANGWYNDDVTVSFSAIDPESTITSVSVPITVTTEGKDQLITGSATNSVGLTGTGSIAISIDKTAPTLNVEDNGVYLIGQKVAWSASDSLSGLTTDASGYIDTSKVGVNQSQVITATDKAGNTVSKTIQYTVFSCSGILQPINSDGSSVFKLGNTIPVKFAINTGSGTYLDGQIFKISVSRISTVSNVIVNETEVTSATANTDNQFRYDLTSGQYIYNFSTKNNIFTSCISGNKYQINVYLGNSASTGNLVATAIVGIK